MTDNTLLEEIWRGKIVAVCMACLPKMGLDVIDASAISQGKTVVDAYVDDPLVYRGKIRARLGAELIKAIPILLPQMSKIYLPYPDYARYC